MIRFSIRFTLVAVGALPLAVMACSRPQARAETTSDLPVVAVTKIGRADLSQTLTIAAEFRPFQEIDVHAKVAGYLKTITVDVGDRVKPGEVLGVLEVPELQDDLKQNEAAVRRAEEDVHHAEADLQRAESVHEVAHLSAARLSAVLKARPNLVAQQDIDDATGRDHVSEAQVSTAQAALAAARQQLDVAKASQNKTATLFGYAQITAPFAGVITHRYADTGAMIQAGTSSQTQTMPIVRLSQNDVLRLVIPIPESAVPRVHVGTVITLAVQALQKTYTGAVARFSDRLDTDTRTMHAEVDVKNPNLEIVPGMYADVSLVLEQSKDVLVAPVEALSRAEDGTSTVFVVSRDGRVERHPVRLGLENPDRVEVTSGVADDDLVVVGNHGQLTAGTRVAPKAIAANTAGASR